MTGRGWRAYGGAGCHNVVQSDLTAFTTSVVLVFVTCRQILTVLYMLKPSAPARHRPQLGPLLKVSVTINAIA